MQSKKNKIKKSISIFAMSVVMFANIFPVANFVVYAEGEDIPPVVETPVVEPPVAEPTATEPEPQVAEAPPEETTTQEEVLPEQEVGTTTPSEESTATITPAIATGTSEQTIVLDTTSSTTEAATVITTTNASSSEISEMEDPLATSTLPTGTTTIDTGDAVSTANVLNILNTSTVNSTGTIQMANLSDGHDGDLDFRSSSGGQTSSGACNLSSCNGVDSISAKMQEDANIENVLALQASSGSNTIQTAGGAAINTGDTYAGLNLVNVANTNIIDSNYFLLTLNSFKDINGDIVLPSLLDFLANVAGGVKENTEITTNSLADVKNNLDMNANTGTNQTENSLYSTTTTGQATNISNVYNNLNSNLFGGKSIYILLRVTGNWLGQIFGLPDGVNFEKEGNLYTLIIEDGKVQALAPGSLSFSGTSTAEITNSVRMLADSGNNQIKDTREAEINTGNSTAVANVVNIANTNIVGKNWMLAVINIFGDFNGNIAFGRPDLKVSQQVSSQGYVQNDSVVNFKLHVKNIGDTVANSAQVVSRYETNYLEVYEASIPYTVDDASNLIFRLGTLDPGEEREIIFNAKVKNTTQGQVLHNTIVASEKETDNNPLDNTNESNIITYLPNASNGPVNNSYTMENVNNLASTTPEQNYDLTINTFVVSREVPVVTITGTTSVVHQKVTLHNLTSQNIQGAVFDDIILDENGEEIQRESWDLGEILGHEQIDLSYDISLSANAYTGSFLMSSELKYSPNKKLIFSNNGKIILTKENIAVSPPALEYKMLAYGGPVSVTGATSLAQVENPATTSVSYVQPNNVFESSNGSSASNPFVNLDIYYVFIFIFSSFLSSLYIFTHRSQV